MLMVGIQRSTEYERKAQHVVDLIRRVASACADYGVRTACPSRLGIDLRIGIGERQDEGVGCHAFALVGRQYTRPGKTKKYVCAVNHVVQCALAGLLCERGLVFVRVSAFINQPVNITEPDVLPLDSDLEQKVQTGDAGGATTCGNEFHFRRVLSDQIRSIEDRCCHDDGCAVLVVMEHRNPHLRPQAVLDDEAVRGLDILKVDGAECRFKAPNRVCECMRIALVDFDVEHIDVGEALEQDGLALHHRLCRESTDAAEPKHRGAVRDYCHQISARGVAGRILGVLYDRVARFRNSGRIGEGEVALVRKRLGRTDRKFSGTAGFMVLESFLLHDQGTPPVRPRTVPAALTRRVGIPLLRSRKAVSVDVTESPMGSECMDNQ